MLRKRLFAFLLCLLVAGLPLAAEATHGGMHASQACMQEDGSSANCNGGGMSNACALHCSMGACVVASISATHLAVPAEPPAALEAVATPDARAAPDTAPPKARLS